MALTFIDGDGGRLPVAAAAPTASQLLADFTTLSPDDRAAFRLAIAPAHHTLSGVAVTAGAETAIAGDTAHDTEDPGPLWMLQRNNPLLASAWQDLLSGAAGPENADAPPDPGPMDPGGLMPGESTPGRLAAVWGVMSHEQRGAFRLAIKPQYSSVADQTARLALTNQVPGDYCRQTGTGLFRLRVLPASTDGNWDLIHPF
ncbi:MAG: hypothetical protein EOP86_16100 [Verrucomicrobiaceae bacterium]|nr:MAG: hypothetical protein EOP86_16100 [Verrucomicrobiaceae bacterium]